MKIEHEYPDYKNEAERERKLKENYVKIQKILYNGRQDRRDKKNINSSRNKD